MRTYALVKQQCMNDLHARAQEDMMMHETRDEFIAREAHMHRTTAAALAAPDRRFVCDELFYYDAEAAEFGLDPWVEIVDYSWPQPDGTQPCPTPECSEAACGRGHGWVVLHLSHGTYSASSKTVAGAHPVYYRTAGSKP
jgi:hypothetical protein